MKGLVKDISSVAIAGLILASGAIAANAQVVVNKVSPSQEKSQDLQATTKALPADKQVVNNSPNQAKYLKSTPENIAAEPSIFLAQNSAPSALRDQLRIKPLPAAYLPRESGGNTPSLNFGTPSGFGAYWGNAFVSASGSTAGKRDKIDGSISVGFGLGTADTVGVEFIYNQNSINKFGSAGTVDVKAHRIVYAEGTNQVSVGVGWNSFAQHVSNGESVRDSSVYGVISSYSQLQANDSYNTMPISFSAGVGGGGFRKAPDSIGVFAGVGVQVLPQFSVGAAWSGTGVNAGVSYVPYPEIPLTFVLTGGDLTGSTGGGTILVLSASYGFNFAK